MSEIQAIGILKIGDNTFHLEEANIYGIFESYEAMTWHIELFPPGDQNYIMLNSLILDDIFSPTQLSEKCYDAALNSDDLYEHTVLVNSEERFLSSLQIRFGTWDTGSQTISFTGDGIVEASNTAPSIIFEFNSILTFKELLLFETTRAKAKLFIDNYLQENKENLAVRFEKALSGLQAIVSGKF